MEKKINPEEKNGKEANGNKPIHRFQCGSVTASVFYNEVEKDGVTYPRYSVAISRSYKVGDEWRRTSSFGVNELHKVITVAQKAFEAVNVNQERADGHSPSSTPNHVHAN